MLYRGDCLEVLKTFPDSYIHSLVTDPPAGIGFMNKEWDKNKGGRDSWILWLTEVMKECSRVLKPGAHGLVWALPRTSHWTATALENAGFEIRDIITHLFGSGFPKSHNLGDGWGTALKPASEHWILIRKPCREKTVAKNVEVHGVGGINIDECRVEFIPNKFGDRAFSKESGIVKNDSNTSGWDSINSAKKNDNAKTSFEKTKSLGRFPANLILDEEAAEMLDDQSGNLHPSGNKNSGLSKTAGMFGIGDGGFSQTTDYKDNGGASRFFYCAKASKKDRGEENHHPTVKSSKLMEYLCKLITPKGGTILDPFMGSGSTGLAAKRLQFEFIGIEENEEYFEIAKKRLASLNPKE